MSTPTQQVREVFLVPQDIHASAENLLAKVQAAEAELRTTAEAFADSLRGVIRTLSIPFQYTYSQVHSLHWQRAFLAERIRAGGTADDAAQAEVDRQRASKKFKEYLQGEGGKVLADEVVDRLLHLKSEHESLAAARELTRQGVVLTWSAIEVIARDAFVYLLNRKPHFADALLADPINKKRFATERVDWQTLAGYGFDMSQKLGTYLVSKADISNVPAIRAAYAAMFPGATELRKHLLDDRLWQLSQKRHLIVHRRGIVDDAYLQATGASLRLGETLWITPSEVEESIEIALALGTELLSQVANAA
jgi:hypothetical protein